MKIILFLNILVFAISSDSVKNIVLREIDTYSEDSFSYTVKQEIDKYYVDKINVYVSVIEDYDNWISLNQSDMNSSYLGIYNDVFGQNKTFFKKREYNDNEMLIEKIDYEDIRVFIMRNHFSAHFGCELSSVKDLSWLDFYDINIANCLNNDTFSNIVNSNNPGDYLKEDNKKNIFKLKKIENKRKLTKLILNITSRKVYIS